MAAWLLGCLMVYVALFGIGKMILGPSGIGAFCLVISAISGYAISWDFSTRGWESLSGRQRYAGARHAPLCPQHSVASHQ